MANLGQTTTSSNRQIVVIDGAWKKDSGRMGMGWALQMVDVVHTCNVEEIMAWLLQPYMLKPWHALRHYNGLMLEISLVSKC